MKPNKLKGKLVTWKDDRGFGFIKSQASSQEIFIHISSLQKSDRRPQVGDIIWYETRTDSQGKTCAVKASLDEFLSQRSRRINNKKTSRSKPTLIFNLVTLFIFGIIALYLRSSRSPSLLSINSDCNIKGNISISTGKKLYHLPEMEDYESTVISLDKGEKWFCSESEAINSGWEQAPR